ncbi:hypothetical protein WDU94_006904 [Cyamophila willieti]
MPSQHCSQNTDHTNFETLCIPPHKSQVHLTENENSIGSLPDISDPSLLEDLFTPPEQVSIDTHHSTLANSWLEPTSSSSQYTNSLTSHKIDYTPMETGFMPEDSLNSALDEENRNSLPSSDRMDIGNIAEDSLFDSSFNLDNFSPMEVNDACEVSFQSTDLGFSLSPESHLSSSSNYTNHSTSNTLLPTTTNLFNSNIQPLHTSIQVPSTSMGQTSTCLDPLSTIIGSTSTSNIDLLSTCDSTCTLSTRVDPSRTSLDPVKTNNDELSSHPPQTNSNHDKSQASLYAVCKHQTTQKLLVVPIKLKALLSNQTETHHEVAESKITMESELVRDSTQNISGEYRQNINTPAFINEINSNNTPGSVSGLNNVNSSSSDIVSTQNSHVPGIYHQNTNTSGISYQHNSTPDPMSGRKRFSRGGRTIIGKNCRQLSSIKPGFARPRVRVVTPSQPRVPTPQVIVVRPGVNVANPLASVVGPVTILQPQFIVVNSNNLVGPANSLVMTTNNPVAHTSNIVIPTNNLVGHTNNIVIPTNNLVGHTNNIVIPTNNLVGHTNNIVIPTNNLSNSHTVPLTTVVKTRLEEATKGLASSYETNSAVGTKALVRPGKLVVLSNQTGNQALKVPIKHLSSAKRSSNSINGTVSTLAKTSSLDDLSNLDRALAMIPQTNSMANPNARNTLTLINHPIVSSNDDLALDIGQNTAQLQPITNQNFASNSYSNSNGNTMVKSAETTDIVPYINNTIVSDRLSGLSTKSLEKCLSSPDQSEFSSISNSTFDSSIVSTSSSSSFLTKDLVRPSFVPNSTSGDTVPNIRSSTFSNTSKALVPNTALASSYPPSTVFTLIRDRTKSEIPNFMVVPVPVKSSTVPIQTSTTPIQTSTVPSVQVDVSSEAKPEPLAFQASQAGQVKDLVSYIKMLEKDMKSSKSKGAEQKMNPKLKENTSGTSAICEISPKAKANTNANTEMCPQAQVFTSRNTEIKVQAKTNTITEMHPKVPGITSAINSSDNVKIEKSDGNLSSPIQKSNENISSPLQKSDRTFSSPIRKYNYLSGQNNFGQKVEPNSIRPISPNAYDSDDSMKTNSPSQYYARSLSPDLHYKSDQSMKTISSDSESDDTGQDLIKMLQTFISDIRNDELPPRVVVNEIQDSGMNNNTEVTNHSDKRVRETARSNLFSGAANNESYRDLVADTELVDDEFTDGHFSSAAGISSGSLDEPQDSKYHYTMEYHNDPKESEERGVKHQLIQYSPPGVHKPHLGEHHHGGKEMCTYEPEKLFQKFRKMMTKSRIILDARTKAKINDFIVSLNLLKDESLNGSVASNEFTSGGNHLPNPGSRLVKYTGRGVEASGHRSNLNTSPNQFPNRGVKASSVFSDQSTHTSGGVNQVHSYGSSSNSSVFGNSSSAAVGKVPKIVELSDLASSASVQSMDVGSGGGVNVSFSTNSAASSTSSIPPVSSNDASFSNTSLTELNPGLFGNTPSMSKSNSNSVSSTNSQLMSSSISSKSNYCSVSSVPSGTILPSRSPCGSSSTAISSQSLQRSTPKSTNRFSKPTPPGNNLSNISLHPSSPGNSLRSFEKLTISNPADPVSSNFKGYVPVQSKPNCSSSYLPNMFVPISSSSPNPTVNTSNTSVPLSSTSNFSSKDSTLNSTKGGTTFK